MRELVQLIDVISWPLAVVILGYIFRNEMRDLVFVHLMPKPRRLSFHFSAKLDEAEVISDSLCKEFHIGPLEEADADYSSRHNVLQRLAKSSPRAAVLETWVELEALVMDLAYKAAIEFRGPIASRRVIEKLIELEKTPYRVLPLYQWLRDLRNKATHVPDDSISADDAERYFRLSIVLMTLLQNKAKGVERDPRVPSIGVTFGD